MFYLGSQYFRAPTPSPDSWDRDVAQARSYGLEYFRLWLMWNWYSRYEDQFDFSSLEQLLDICSHHGMRAILLVNLESAPAWLVRKYPDSVYRDATGGRYSPESVGNTPSGGFPGLCFHNPAVVEHGRRYIAELAGTFRNHPAVECWEPHNEPMFEPGRYNDHFYCYCDHSITAFRSYLTRTYGTIDGLNRAWRRNYGTFEEVLPPRRRGMYNDWLDWRTFMLEHLIETLQWRIDTIREFDPDHYVMIHTRGGSGVTRNLAKEGIDDYRMAVLADKYGTAAFPQCGPEHEYFIAMTGARCASRGKEFWMAELQAGPYGMGVHRSDAEPVCEYCGSSTMEATIDRKEGVFDPGEVTPDRLSMWSWSGVAQGAKGILYWQYRNESFGLEYGFGLTQLDGTPSPRLESVKQFAESLKANESLLDGALPVASEVAIAWDPRNDIINWTAVGCTDAVKNSIKGLHRALWHADFPLDVVRLDTAVVDEDFSRYTVLYVPFSPFISSSSAEKLRDYVARGGVVVAEGSSAQFADDMGVSPVVPGNGLDELFGCRRADIRTLHRSLMPRLRIGTRTISTRMHKEMLTPLDGATVIGHFTTGEPAVVRNQYGKGTAIYIGSNPFMTYANETDTDLLDWVCELNSRVSRPAFTSVPDIVARVLVNGDHRIVFVLNTLATPSSVVTSVPGAGPDTRVHEVLGGQAAESRLEGDVLQLIDDMPPYGVRVFDIR